MKRIKRPLVGMAIVYILADVCAMVNLKIITFIICSLILGWLILEILLKKYSTIYLSFILLFCIAYVLTKKNLEPNLISSYIEDETVGVSVNIIGTVDKIQDKETYIQIFIKDNRISLSKDPSVNSFSSGVILKVSEYNCEIGDIISVSGRLKEFPSPRNTGEFNSKLYYKTINYEFKCSGEIIKIIKPNENELLSVLNIFKNKMKKSYSTISNDTDSGIFNSIILGDKQELDENISDLYKDNGIAHLLAISGLHISIIGMSIYKMLRKTGMNFLKCAVISAAIIICYGIITGNGVSTMRALVMFVVAVGAGIFGRAYDILSATSLASIIILMESPLMLLNGGFLLSFGAILGIVVVAPTIKNLFYGENEGKNNVFLMVLISFSINLITLPVLLYFFFQIPLYSVIINIIVIPLMTFVMISAVSGGLLGMISNTIGVFFIGMAHYILALYEMICNVFSQLPFSVIIVGQPSVIKIVLYYFILGFLVVYVKYAKKINKWVAILIPLMIFIISYRSYEGLQVNMIDVGQGDSIFVRTPLNTTYLFDCGSTDIKNVGKFRIVPWLKANGVRKLDYIVISHSDSDHMNGLIELLESDNCYGIRIKNIILPWLNKKETAYLNLEKAILDKGIHLIYAYEGFEFGDQAVSMKCLHPSKKIEYKSTNGYSTTISLKYKNFDMLFTGDLETDGENDLISKKLIGDYDVLKVAHHGSKLSSQQSFLDIIKPEIALISCGINSSYGHPHKELLERLKGIKSKIYITPECGEISIKTDGNRVKVERLLKK